MLSASVVITAPGRDCRMRSRLFQRGAVLSSAAVLIAGIMTTGAAAALPAASAAAFPKHLLDKFASASHDSKHVFGITAG